MRRREYFELDTQRIPLHVASQHDSAQIPALAGKLVLPGGFVECDETVEQGAAPRTGGNCVRIKPSDLRMIGVYSEPSWAGRQRRLILRCGARTIGEGRG